MVLYGGGLEWTGHGLPWTRLLLEQLLGRSIEEPLLGWDGESMFDPLGETLAVMVDGGPGNGFAAFLRTTNGLGPEIAYYQISGTPNRARNDRGFETMAVPIAGQRARRWPMTQNLSDGFSVMYFSFRFFFFLFRLANLRMKSSGLQYDDILFTWASKRARGARIADKPRTRERRGRRSRAERGTSKSRARTAAGPHVPSVGRRVLLYRLLPWSRATPLLCETPAARPRHLVAAAAIASAVNVHYWNCIKKKKQQRIWDLIDECCRRLFLPRVTVTEPRVRLPGLANL